MKFDKKYITFSEDAVHKILSDRRFSSFDFDDAEQLINIFLYKREDLTLGDNSQLKLIVCKNGYNILGYEEKYNSEKNNIIFDMSSIDISLLERKLQLTAIHKVLRFSVRYWSKKNNYNDNEYFVPESTKVIVFPFPLSGSTSYRFTIERDASKDNRRFQKRYSGMHLFVYKFGTTEGAGSKEVAELDIFNKAVEEFFQTENYREYIVKNISNNKLISVISLDDYQKNFLTLQSLSRKQVEFIESPFDIPSRVEGAAGSGKTLCMIMKCIYWVQKKRQEKTPHKALFVVPSNAMVNNVKIIFESYGLKDIDTNVDILTLQDVCFKFLKNDLSINESLDNDNMESKNTQLLYLCEIIENIRPSIDQHRLFLSNNLFQLLKNEELLKVAELLRHEISVVIKGRADERYESYQHCRRPTYGLPIETNSDRSFIFGLFRSYNQILENISQYDADDIAISTISRLDTPIWRRRRLSEGYDVIYIDEAHLFNLNELSIIHFLTKKTDVIPVSFALDISQAIGDIAWDDGEFLSTIGSAEAEKKTKLNTVFRCSSKILELAFSITSHGACLFSNFQNPIELEQDFENGSIKVEEPPKYFLIRNKDIIFESFKKVESLRIEIKRHEIALIFFDRLLLEEAVKYAENNKKSHVLLTKRGDISCIKTAEKNSAIILCMADYVGGLEFEAVILVGVDKSRVPPNNSHSTVASKIYQSYVAHNRMYVAVTRAKKIVYLIGDADIGLSDVVESAVNLGVLDVINE